MELVKYFSAKLEKLESAERTKYFPVLEEDVLGGPTDEGSIEDSMVLETLVSTPNKPVVSVLKQQAIVEEDSSLFLHEISHDVFTFGTEKKDSDIVPIWPVVPSFDDYLEKYQ